MSYNSISKECVGGLFLSNELPHTNPDGSLIRHFDQPVCITIPAGCGKTTLSARFPYIIDIDEFYQQIDFDEDQLEATISQYYTAKPRAKILLTHCPSQVRRIGGIMLASFIPSNGMLPFIKDLVSCESNPNKRIGIMNTNIQEIKQAGVAYHTYSSFDELALMVSDVVKAKVLGVFSGWFFKEEKQRWFRASQNEVPPCLKNAGWTVPPDYKYGCMMMDNDNIQADLQEISPLTSGPKPSSRFSSKAMKNMREWKRVGKNAQYLSDLRAYISYFYNCQTRRFPFPVEHLATAIQEGTFSYVIVGPRTQFKVKYGSDHLGEVFRSSVPIRVREIPDGFSKVPIFRTSKVLNNLPLPCFNEMKPPVWGWRRTNAKDVNDIDRLFTILAKGGTVPYEPPIPELDCQFTEYELSEKRCNANGIHFAHLGKVVVLTKKRAHRKMDVDYHFLCPLIWRSDILSFHAPDPLASSVRLTKGHTYSFNVQAQAQGIVRTLHQWWIKSDNQLNLVFPHGAGLSAFNDCHPQVSTLDIDDYYHEIFKNELFWIEKDVLKGLGILSSVKVAYCFYLRRVEKQGSLDFSQTFQFVQQFKTECSRLCNNGDFSFDEVELKADRKYVWIGKELNRIKANIGTNPPVKKEITAIERSYLEFAGLDPDSVSQLQDDAIKNHRKALILVNAPYEGSDSLVLHASLSDYEGEVVRGGKGIVPFSFIKITNQVISRQSALRREFPLPLLNVILQRFFNAVR